MLKVRRLKERRTGTETKRRKGKKQRLLWKESNKERGDKNKISEVGKSKKRK